MRKSILIAALATVVALPASAAASEPAAGGSAVYVIEGVVTGTHPPVGIGVRVMKANANARQGLRGKKSVNVNFDRARTRIIDAAGAPAAANAIRRGDRVVVRLRSHPGAVVEYIRYAELVRLVTPRQS